MSSDLRGGTTGDVLRCGCCGEPRRQLAELGVTPGVFICRRCALWAARRAGPHPDPRDTAVPIPGPSQATPDPDSLRDEMGHAANSLHELIQNASRSDLRRATMGTRWTNRQLLFHMMFGYLIVRRLLPLVRVFDRLPDSASRRFADVLSSATRPFHLVNYIGSWAAGSILTAGQTERMMERTVQALQRSLRREDDVSLQRSMYFPTSWDPYFTATMTVADVYHFGTQHFNHHREQLTLTARR